MSEKDLWYKYQAAAEQANHFSMMARDPITHELADYYQREAAKYALLLHLKDKTHHHYGKTGYHCKNKVRIV